LIINPALMENPSIRVRFAPSPTGPLHIGGVRTALYNYLFARNHGGKVILRIEDTDQNRYVPNAEQYIRESLDWCGIVFDEDPWKGGPYGPYRQSDRKGMYRQYAEQLVVSGNAYYAFDTEEELDAMRERLRNTDPAYAQYGPLTRMSMKNSLSLPPGEVRDLLDNGKPFVIRIRIPENEDIIVNDRIRGEVVVQSRNLDDKVLYKSDGWPTYHLANVVDDHLMEISHVIRGEEWLPSAPLHVLLYRFLGWESGMPQFAHLPLLLKPDGNGKLSKRDGDRLGFPVFPLVWKDPVSGEVSSGYRESGYFPEAFINMLAFLGWNPGTEQELFSLAGLTEHFSLERVGKHGSKFDPEKAKWFNHQYLVRKPDEELARLMEPELVKRGIRPDPDYLARVCGIIRERAHLIPELWSNSWFFFLPPSSYNEQMRQKVWKPETAGIIREYAGEAENLDPFNHDSLQAMTDRFLKERGVKTGQLMMPLRLLLVGENVGPGILEIAGMIGKSGFLSRIGAGLSILG
jgi:glutamyl-tRNA synthetase